MNRCAVVLVLPLAAAVAARADGDAPAGPAAERPAQEQWTLWSADGGELRAALVSYDADDGRLVLRRAFSSQSVALPATDFVRMTRRVPLRPNEPRGRTHWEFLLSGGDRLFAASFEADERQFRIGHPGLGAVTIPRSAVRAISEGTPLDLVYEGPQPGELWGTDAGKVRLTRAVLPVAARSVAGRPIDGFPRQAGIEFTLHGSAARTIRFQGAAVGGPREPESLSYSLTQSGRRWQLFRHAADGVRPIGSATLPPDPVAGPPRVRVRLFVSHDPQRIVLYVDDRKAGDWADPHPAFEPGNALTFISFSPAAYSVTDIRIHRWNGVVPPDAPPESELHAPDEDGLLLTNGDRAAGAWLGVRGGMLTFRGGAVGEFAVPLDRVARIVLRNAPAGDSLPDGLTRFRLTDDSRLTLRVRRIEDGRVQAEWPDRRPIRFPLDAVREIFWPARPPAPVTGATPRKRGAGRGARPAPARRRRGARPRILFPRSTHSTRGTDP